MKATVFVPPKSPLWIRTLHRLGTPVTEQIAVVREFGGLYVRAVAQLFHRPWRWREILIAVAQIGVGSLPIISIATMFAGLVITNEIAWHMDEALHTISMMPGFTGQFIIRELGIAIPALLLAAKAGAAITAEVGSMKITEQLDALRLLGIDPFRYLVFPRFVACIISTACLTLISITITLGCALSVAVIRYHFSPLEYLNALRHFIGVGDIAVALVKGVVFGSVIPIVSCAYGFRCKGGAEGVGSVTTDSVVTSTLLIILLDFVLTFFSTLIL